MSMRAIGERMRVTPSNSLAELLHPTGCHDWRGASGRTFPSTVYTLLGCPAVTAASWVLVRRLEDGARIALATGRTESSAPTLNLAHVRWRAAQLEADEVHLCDVADGLVGDDATGQTGPAVDIAEAEGVPVLAATQAFRDA